MKKLSTLFFVLLIASVSFSQSTHTVDFESDGVGADWEWSVSENDDNPALEFVDNPASDDVNSSATVAMFTARETGNNWALCFTDDDGDFTFDESNSTITIMVYKSTISNIGFKVTGGTGTETELKVANTLTDEWEEITFDFSSLNDQKFGTIVIIPDFVDYTDGTDRTSENIVYFDNIQMPDGVVVILDEPETSASALTQNESNVISIYSDTYTDVADTDFNPDWGQSTAVSYETIGDNNVLLYSSLSYQGTQFTSQDVSDYDYLHVDFWTDNSEDLGLYLIGTGGEEEHEFTIVTDEWVSVDIPLTDYSSTVDLTDVYQFKVSGDGTIWFDNLYFWKDVSTEVEDNVVEDIEVYPNPASDIIHVNGVGDGELISIYSSFAPPIFTHLLEI